MNGNTRDNKRKGLIMYKTVVGDYTSVDDAKQMVDYMLARGIPKDSISIIANRSAAAILRDTGVLVALDFDYVDDVSDETLWQRIKSFFGVGAEKEHDIDVSRYADSIRAGNVLVLVDESLVPTRLAGIWKTRTTGQPQMKHAEAPRRDTFADTASIRLEEERMQVDKRPVQTGEVVVHKRIVEETETVDVPVRHEEVVIERVHMNDQPDTNPRFEDETITIPVMEEKVEVTKRPVITDEIKIHKQNVEKTEPVTTTLRKEKLDVDRSGKAVLTGERSRSNRV